MRILRRDLHIGRTLYFTLCRWFKTLSALILLHMLITCRPTSKPFVPTEFGNEWILSELFQASDKEVTILGSPQMIKCEYGTAMLFNGSTDAIIIDAMPLSGLSRFTVEALIRPDSSGKFEQRFLHCGSSDGDRLLLEIRSTATSWYLDSFFKSGNQQKALLDENLQHPLDQWYHVAFVVDKGRQTTYVNGREELNSNLNYAPILNGKSSVGVRQNQVSWFKGAIYKIKFSPSALNPTDFMNY